MKTKQLILTSLSLVLTLCLFEVSDLDLVVQQYFYDAQQHLWMISKDNAVLDLIFYSGFKRVLIGIALSILIALIIFRDNAWIKSYKPGLLIVLLSLLVVPLVIGELKAVTNVACPKQLTIFGGNYPYISVFEHYPDNFEQVKPAKCFPAGHASGGFALMSLFFLFKRRRNRLLGLAVGISSGWATGGYKMLIGDHFLSHTIVTMLLAWLLIMIIAGLVKHDHQAAS